MNITTRRRLVSLLLPLSVGVIGAIAYAVNNAATDHGANPAGTNTNTGTGTVNASPSASPNGNGNGGNGGGPKGEFFIAGTVAGLRPGVSGTLTLTITNPNPWPIQVLT